MIRPILIDFREFLRNPQQIVDTPQHRPFRTWLSVMAIDIILTAAVFIPLIYIVDEHFVHLRPIPEINKPMTLWFMVTVMVVIAPMAEELVFRYPLKFARNRVLKVAVYVSSLVFGFYHLSNYTNQEIGFYALSPIIIGSQLLGGFLLAYLRLKHGLRWSILAHAAINALALIPATLLLHGNTTIDHASSDYTLLVKEYTYLDSKKPVHLQITRKNSGIDTLIVRQQGLQTVLDAIETPGTHYVANALVDIDFTTASAISSDSLINLLRQEYRIVAQ